MKQELKNKRSIIGRSLAIRQVRALLDDQSNQPKPPILIRGEPGTGRSHVARQIHLESGRGQFVEFQTRSIVQTWKELLIFGNANGQELSGFMDRYHAHFNQAIGGTLYIHEIDEIACSPETQTMLVASLTEWKNSFRLVCSTCRNLKELAVRGEVRADLVERVSSTVMMLPPLRERREDVVPLAQKTVHAISEGELATTPSPDKKEIALYDFMFEKLGGREIVLKDFARAQLQQIDQGASETVTDLMEKADSEGWGDGLRQLCLRDLAGAMRSTGHPNVGRMPFVSSGQRILNYIEDNPWCTTGRIMTELPFSRPTIYGQMKRLLENGAVEVDHRDLGRPITKQRLALSQVKAGEPVDQLNPLPTDNAA